MLKNPSAEIDESILRSLDSKTALWLVDKQLANGLKPWENKNVYRAIINVVAADQQAAQQFANLYAEYGLTGDGKNFDTSYLPNDIIRALSSEQRQEFDKFNNENRDRSNERRAQRSDALRYRNSMR